MLSGRGCADASARSIGNHARPAAGKRSEELPTKRMEKFDKISENRKVVDAQCSAVEDVLMLVRDQSVTMRDPQQVSERLDSLVHDVEQTEQTVQQVEAIFS